MFHTASHSLILLDTMKMAKWAATSEWGAKRSPDALLEFSDFANNLLVSVSRKPPTMPICAFLLEQSYFNGIGNYLRAEILVRAGLDPFQDAEKVFANSPKSFTMAALSGIIEEASAPLEAQKAMHKTIKHDPGLMIIFLARQIQIEVLADGGMNKYGSPEEQAKFKSWLRVYGKGKEVKVGGRSVHCTVEQRLGRQERDLGLFIDKYPFDVPSIYYEKPTLSISSGVPKSASANSAGASTTIPTTIAGANFTGLGANAGSFQMKRVDEVIFPLDKIVDLHVPMMSKLLLAVTSLSRNGALTFTFEPFVRELIVLGNPIAFAAWQACESNLDEAELVDTLMRLVNKKLPELTRNLLIATAVADIEREASREAVSQTLAQFGGIELDPPTTKRAVSKRDRSTSNALSSESSSSSTSLAGSDNEGSDISDDEDMLSRPSKKKAIAGQGRGKSVLSKNPRAKKVAEPKAKKAKSVFSGTFGAPSAAPSSSLAAKSSKESSSGMDFVALLSEPSWCAQLAQFLRSKAMANLAHVLPRAYEVNNPPVYPPRDDIFNAFKLCPLDKVKVVILGQDPYHGPGQAHGLCFSVKAPTNPPPSLVNIYKELEKDIPGFKNPGSNGDLTPWARQGVLLLNTVLTVYQKQPNSHADMGWEKLTDLVIETIVQQRKSVIFMLWGKPSQKKASLISKDHVILAAAHPSPFSASHGWFGCKHFSKANTILAAAGQTPIDWTIPPK